MNVGLQSSWQWNNDISSKYALSWAMVSIYKGKPCLAMMFNNGSKQWSTLIDAEEGYQSYDNNQWGLTVDDRAFFNQWLLVVMHASINDICIYLYK